MSAVFPGLVRMYINFILTYVKGIKKERENTQMGKGSGKKYDFAHTGEGS